MSDVITFPALRDRIKPLTPAELRWGFDGKCSFQIELCDDKTECIYNLDSVPCYSHDVDLVRRIAELCEKRFPTKFPTFYAILPFEPEDRVNGTASKEYTYHGEKPTPYVGVILLNGKRIPIHPAMTRYLVAHEYGHIADFHLCFQRGLEDNGLDKEYAEMRGIPLSTKYGPGNWHTNIGEVIANDFRISVCGVESEFWPHPYPHPDQVPNVGQFWSEMMLKFVPAPRATP